MPRPVEPLGERQPNRQERIGRLLRPCQLLIDRRLGRPAAGLPRRRIGGSALAWLAG